MNLLLAIERCLKQQNMPPSRFGREAASDPRLVFDLRRGRQLRAGTECRVRAYIAATASVCPPSTAALPTSEVSQ